MSQEDALFKLADALIGLWSEHGDISRYISDDDFNDCLNSCKDANKKRYTNEILIHF